jgi:hypothetical protein
LPEADRRRLAKLEEEMEEDDRLGLGTSTVKIR